MRTNQYDIRQFNFGQLVKFIDLVGKNQPQDLHVFRKYVDAAISQEYFKENELDSKIVDFTNVLLTFAMNGEPIDGPAMLKYLILLKNKVLASE